MPRFDDDNGPSYLPLSQPPASTPEVEGGVLATLDLPKEVSTAEAAEILGRSMKTVLKYLRNGLLEWRDVAAPGSSRPYYRITLDSVLKLRTSYRFSTPHPARLVQRSVRRPIQQAFKSKHITFR